MLRWTAAALRHWGMVGAFTLFGAVLATVATLVYGSEYTAESSYIPHIWPYMRGPAPIRFTALLGRSGVRIPYSEASEQPKFYEAFVTSRTILTEVARFNYRFPRGRDHADSLEGNLLELWGAHGDSEEERLATAVRRLERLVSADMDLRTGIVAVRTRAPWPDLAEQINRRILQSIQDFIFLKRREKYEAMHEFAGRRAQVAGQELSSAEAALLGFQVRNRRYDNSPLLELEEQRLRDEMERRLQLHVSLLLAVEETRIERLRDTPFITVIASPEGGARRTGPRLPVAIPVGFVVGNLLGIAWAFGLGRTEARARSALVGAMLTATAGTMLVACGDTTAPGTLVIEVAGRLERSSVVTLSATFEGTILPDSEVTWTAEPAGAVSFLAGSRAALVQAGQVTLSAHADMATGTRTIAVAIPPTIVFDLLRDGNRDIYLAALDGGDLVRLTTDLGDDSDPTAVGDQVVFVSYRDGNGELYVTSLDGDAPTRLTVTAVAEAGPALSRDGAWLAYTRSDGGVPKLWVSLSNGGGAARVTGTFGFAGSIEASPSWDPSGGRVAFVSTSAGTADLFTYTVSTGGFAPLVSDSASRAEVEPAWSPDGAWVAFATDRPGDTEIYLLEVATGELRRLTDRPDSDGQPTWLPDGRLVYVAWTGGSPRLRWLDPQVPHQIHDIDVGPGEPRHPAGVLSLPASQ